MKPKKLLAVCGACAVTGAPAAAALAAGGPTPAALAPHSPVTSALADRQAEHDVLRLARRRARVAHLRVRRGYVHRVQSWSPARLHRERRALRAEIRELRRTGDAPNVPVPAVLRSIAACESGGDPHAVGGGGSFRGKYQFRLRHVGARRRQRRSGRRARGRAGPSRGDALRPRRLVAVARVRRVDSLRRGGGPAPPPRVSGPPGNGPPKPPARGAPPPPAPPGAPPPPHP